MPVFAALLKKSWKQILINDFDVIITDRELQAGTNLAKMIEGL